MNHRVLAGRSERVGSVSRASSGFALASYLALPLIYMLSGSAYAAELKSPEFGNYVDGSGSLVLAADPKVTVAVSELKALTLHDDDSLPAGTALNIGKTLTQSGVANMTALDQSGLGPIPADLQAALATIKTQHAAANYTDRLSALDTLFATARPDLTDPGQRAELYVQMANSLQLTSYVVRTGSETDVKTDDKTYALVAGRDADGKLVPIVKSFYPKETVTSAHVAAKTETVEAAPKLEEAKKTPEKADAPAPEGEGGPIAIPRWLKALIALVVVVGGGGGTVLAVGRYRRNRAAVQPKPAGFEGPNVQARPMDPPNEDLAEKKSDEPGDGNADNGAAFDPDAYLNDFLNVEGDE